MPRRRRPLTHRGEAGRAIRNSANRRGGHANVVRERRLAEEARGRAERLLADSVRASQRRQREESASRTERLQSDALRASQRRQEEDAARRTERLQSHALRASQRRQEEDAARRTERLQSDALRASQRRQEEDVAHRTERLQSDAVRASQRRQEEDAAHRTERLAAQRRRSVDRLLEEPNAHRGLRLENRRFARQASRQSSIGADLRQVIADSDHSSMCMWSRDEQRAYCSVFQGAREHDVTAALMSFYVASGHGHGPPRTVADELVTEQLQAMIPGELYMSHHQKIPSYGKIF